MKMFSKEGQILVDVTELHREGDNIVMKGKLMNAYSMNIYVRPEEVWRMLKLVSWRIILYVPLMLMKGWRRVRREKKANKASNAAM